MTRSPKKNFVFLCLATLAPLWLAFYSLYRLGQPLTWRWGLDALSFCALYMAIFAWAPKKLWLRFPFAFIVVGWFIFFHVGNVAYYNFYDTWVHLHIFDQWKDSLSLGRSITQLLEPKDLFAGVLGPLAAAMSACLIDANPPRLKASPAFLLAALFFLALHWFAAGNSGNTKFQEPMMYFIRAPFDARLDAFLKRKRIERVAKHPGRYFPLDQSKYERKTDADPPFASEPVGGAKAPERKLNIVFILMESVVAAASGSYGADPSFTPNFDVLAADGLLAANFYANGSQTVRGELASLCSYYPNYRGGPIYTRYHKTKMTCLPEILKGFGYETMWISSYKKSYSKKGRFLRRHGVKKIYDLAAMPPGYKKIGWGPSDEDLFESAAARLGEAAEPFFAEIMTLSNHHPFSWPYPSNAHAPKGGFGAEYENYMRGNYYTDYAIGRFFERVRESEWFSRTIFVITGDHGIWLFDEDKGPVEKQEAYFRVPFLIYAPGIVEPRVFEDVASQVDIAPTLLDLIGASASNTFVGRSLLADSDEPRFALMLHDRQWNIRRGNEYCYEVGEQCFYEHIPWCPKGYKKDPNQPVSCFVFNGDLLRDPKSWSALPEIGKNRSLMSFAEDLTAFNHDRLLRTKERKSKK